VRVVGGAQCNFRLPARKVAHFGADFDSQFDLGMGGTEARQDRHIEPGQDIDGGELDVSGQAMVAPGDVALEQHQLALDPARSYEKSLAFWREANPVVPSLGQAGTVVMLK